MKKIYIGIAAGIIVVGALLFFFKFRTSSLEKTLEQVKEYNSYTLTANMEMLENDEIKSYLVNVSYLKNEKQEYYKVELYDKSINQSQVILRNKEGVFVLTPTLNQIFKFQSDWPNNSPKPYIYHSLLDFLANNESEKTDNGYVVKGAITYPNDNRVKAQEIMFDSSLQPQNITVYDEDETELIRVDVTEFNTSPGLSESAFNQDSVLKDTASAYSDVSASLPLYPVALMGATLESEDQREIEGTMNHILQFVGEKEFTVIESIQSEATTPVVESIDGELIDFIDSIGYYNNNQLTVIQSGIVCSIYSKDLNKDEMVSVISSMQSSSLK